MAETTKIEWADHTFNPWIGCTKVSPACDNCYAEAQAKRHWPDQGLWTGSRRRTTEAYWKAPLRWNRQAPEFLAKHGRSPFVFCASLADVFDNQVPPQWRRDLWQLIDATPNLLWLLLTKRPQNIRKMLPDVPGSKTFAQSCPPWGAGWRNVWIGTTVENQEEAARRIPALLSAPSAGRFLSCEPLLGPVDITRREFEPPGHRRNDLTGVHTWDDPRNVMGGALHGKKGGFTSIDWVIAGGESGPGARPSNPDWFRALRNQCEEASTPFLFKQWGEWSANAFHGSDRDKMHIFEGEGALQRPVYRVGKKAAGRLLDGELHNEIPQVTL